MILSNTVMGFVLFVSIISNTVYICNCRTVFVKVYVPHHHKVKQQETELLNCDRDHIEQYIENNYHPSLVRNDIEILEELYHLTKTKCLRGQMV